MTSFSDLGVPKNIVKAMEDMGWKEPTPIQIEAIPEGLKGSDMFAQAQTGTGKTGTYATIVLGRVKSGSKKPSVLVMAPTRELANQVSEEFTKLSRYTGHRCVPIYGGASIDVQVKKLRRGVDIVVGTPGRIMDLMERHELDISDVREVVLDEADRMLDMGFIEDMDFILARTPSDRHTLMFSATMSEEIRYLALNQTHDPKEILVSKDEIMSDLTTQYYIPTKRGAKRSILYNLLDKERMKTIIFCQTKSMVDEINDTLVVQQYRVGSMHGSMPQIRREKIIKNFRNGNLDILVATDVAARGLDVNNIDRVINFDMPDESDTYVHRIGRTGRAGKEGIAVSFVTPIEEYRIKILEYKTGKTIRKLDPRDYRTEKEKVVSEPYAVSEEPCEGEERKPRVKSDFAVIEINLGKMDGFGKSSMADFVKQNAKLTGTTVGKVGLGTDTSFVEVHKDSVKDAVSILNECRHNGKSVFVRIAPKKARYKDMCSEDTERPAENTAEVQDDQTAE